MRIWLIRHAWGPTGHVVDLRKGYVWLTLCVEERKGPMVFLPTIKIDEEDLYR